MKVLHYLLLCTLVEVSITSSSLAEHVSKIEYIGYKRVEPETIESYLPLSVGDEVDSNSINEALKALDATGFFEEVSIEMRGSVLIVKVKEAPIINKISFEGNSKLPDRDINKVIMIKAKQTLSPAKVKEIQQGLLDAYRKMGRYNAKIEPKIIRLPNNQVNLVFEINEGDVAGIGRIVFVGNNSFSASELRDVIYTRVKRWYRFFVNDDTYDSERVAEDKLAIVKFYQERGYADANVISATAELSNDKKEFILTFVINEGQLYNFGDIDIKSHIKNLGNADLSCDLDCKKGGRFNINLLNADSAKIAKRANDNGFASVKIEPKFHKSPGNGVVRVTFNVLEGDGVYVSKIIIKGNTRTRDHIIRREIAIEEGDAYSQIMVMLAEANLRSLGYFKSVNIETIQDPNAPDKCILQVSLEEGSTGEAMVAANYSTQEGIGLDLSYSEINFLGTGKSLSVCLGSSRSRTGRSFEIDPVTKRERRVPRKSKFRILNHVSVSVSDPHIFGKDIIGTVGASRYQNSRWDAFATKEISGSLGAAYSLSSKISQSWDYTLTGRKFEDVMPHATPIIKYQTMEKSGDQISTTRPGKCNSSAIKHTISYGTSFLTGLKGSFKTWLSTTVAGLGGDARHLKNELSGTYIMPINRQTNVRVSVSCGLLSKLGSIKPNISDSFALGLDTFRGFDDCGCGPVAETVRAMQSLNPLTGQAIIKSATFRDYVGATKYWKGTVEFTFPVGLSEELGMRGFVFSDFGTLWGPPENGKNFLKKSGKKVVIDKQNNVALLAVGKTAENPNSVSSELEHIECAFDQDSTSIMVSHRIRDTKKIRASLGFGISLVTPLGPMRFTYAFPIRKEKYDEPYRFLIGFSTTF
ncbi:MAG: outer membrane protein assembly factor BamA [Holosporales bacterium]|jgi:outer membrane protein insertion porin family|nr:outer membrane protein assembly factor BamA [Holosporales bacterium]